MIIIYLIVLIFILILLVLNNKEYFVAQCSYVPWGPTYDFCVSNCKSKSRIGLWDLTGNFCNEDICREKCLNCDHERCEWLSIWDKKQIKKEKDESVNNDINSLVPKSLVINGISYLNNFTLSWNNNNDSEKIMIHILNLSDPSNKIDIISVHGSETTKDIDDLEEAKEYSITAYSLNKYGASRPSNTIITKLN
jgi:hypothetical protein